MNAAEIARRVDEEHAVVERLARGLREWSAVVPRANLAHWIDGARQRFEHFRAHLLRHFAEEGSEGYIHSVADFRPALAGEIKRLEHEHDEMMHMLEGIQRDLQGVSAADHLRVRDLCLRLGHFLEFLEHHEHEEHMLITFAFTAPAPGLSSASG